MALNERTMLVKERGQVTPMGLDRINFLVKDLDSWARYTLMLLGGPPAKMQVHMTSGATQELLVVTPDRHDELR